MNVSRVIVYGENPDLLKELEALLASKYTVAQIKEPEALAQLAEDQHVALILLILPESHPQEALHDVGQYIGKDVPLLVVTSIHPSLALINEMLKMQVLGVLHPSLKTPKAKAVIQEALENAPRVTRRRRLEQDFADANKHLNRRLQEINTIYSVGKYVASSLNLDNVLERVVEASVNLTQADEGFILLKEGEKLFLRASKNMGESLAQRLNVEAADSVAWQVIHSGRPTMLRRQTKLSTGYLVRALLYVPLQTPGQGTTGVLGVVNRQQDQEFTEHQLFTLSSLADFAAVALENARLFSAVEAEQLRLRAILEHASEAILVTDINNHLLLWSQTATEAFHIPSSAQGHAIEGAVQHPAVLELFNQTQQNGLVLHTEVPFDKGEVFNAQLTTIPGIGRVMIMQNITHLKELDRLKSEFVSTVSHDLRTPLTTIQGYVELLDRVGPLTEMQQSFIGKALTSLRHITELIGDLLDIGRIEAGYDLEMQPCRLDELIATVGEETQPQVEQQDVKLYWTLEEDHTLLVQGNPRRLRQVIENLISNAAKYNHPGGEIEIKAHHDDDHIVVQVRDTGIGIPLEEQPKIFERFYRVQSPETEDIHGTGLGLAIVKSVIEKHKGRIWVESTFGKGSQFSFVIPALAS